MGMRNKYKCSNCDFEEEISGPWEFYRDENGIRHPYGHPGALSKEAEAKGVKGFYEVGYCSKCNQVRDAITLEFEKPVYEDWWGKAIDEEGKRFKPTCSECGTKLYGFLDNICPKCGKPCLTTMEWSIS